MAKTMSKVSAVPDKKKEHQRQNKLSGTLNNNNKNNIFL